MDIDTGTLIFRGYSRYRLADLGIGVRERNKECRWWHQFRDVLYGLLTMNVVAARVFNSLN